MKAVARYSLLPVCLLLLGTALILKPSSPHEGAKPAVEQGLSAQAKRTNPARAPNTATAFPQNNTRRDPGAASQTLADPEILEFKQLKQKALRSKKDIAGLARLRRDHQVLRRAFDKLSDFDSEIPERQELVSLVQDALLDQENPERAYVIAQTEKLILADNLRPEQNRANRRELAADKGELTLAYLDAQPGRHSFLLEASAGSPNIQVIRNAMGVGERRRSESLSIIQDLEGSVSN